jgi:hypothetical protein
VVYTALEPAHRDCPQRASAALEQLDELVTPRLGRIVLEQDGVEQNRLCVPPRCCEGARRSVDSPGHDFHERHHALFDEIRQPGERVELACVAADHRHVGPSPACLIPPMCHFR